MPTTLAGANLALDRVYTGVYVGLFTVAPTRTTNGTEAAYTGYARVAATFASASSASKANSVDVEFPEAASSGGTATHFGVFSAATGGVLISYGVLTTEDDLPALIGIGDAPTFAAGSLVLTEVST